MCPRIETSRLILTAHTRDDLGDLAAMWADPGVVRHISGKASTLQESWHRLLRYRGLWPVLGYGYWCVRDKRSGRFVGDVGFADFRRDTEPPISGAPEAGWVLATWAHGQGFASEATAAMFRWLDGCTQHERTVCLLATENTPSARIAAKNGFVAFGTVRLGSEDVPLWSRERSA